LTIATDIGEPGAAATRKVKSNGKDVPTAIFAQMLAKARTRAKSPGLDSIMEFRESDAEILICLNQ
jgi:ubiquinone/menaquinone biosynthesis C-methylase UbiE